MLATQWELAVPHALGDAVAPAGHEALAQRNAIGRTVAQTEPTARAAQQFLGYLLRWLIYLAGWLFV